MAKQNGFSIMPGMTEKTPLSRMNAAVISAHLWAGAGGIPNLQKKAFIGAVTFISDEVMVKEAGEMLEQEAGRYL